MKFLSLTIIAILGLACQSTAQTNFSATLTGTPLVTTGWNYSSISSVSANTFILTQPTTSQAGYIYYNTPVNLATCGQFTVSFEYQVTNSSNPPADGLTFFYVSNPPTGFVGGASIGMPNNPNGLVLIFDTYDNNSTPDNPLITLRGYNGAQNYVEGSTVGQLGNVIINQNYVTNGNWNTATMTYNNGNIVVTSNGNTIITANYPLSINGYFGFSAGTGALYSKHSIRNVSITGVLPPAPPGIAASTITYCQYDTPVTLSATGTNLKWYTSLTSITQLPGAPTPNTQVPGQTTWYVAQGATNGCDGPRSPITVTVYAKPPAPIVLSPTHYCVDEPASPWQFNGQNITWYPTQTGGTGTTTLPVISTTSPSNNTWYISQTVNGCESDRTLVNLTVAAKPAPPKVQTPLIYCQGDAAPPLTAVGQNLLWYNGAVGGGGSVVPPVPSTLVEDTLTWWVTQSNTFCESIRTKVEVQVRYKPNGIIVPTSASICQGDVDTFYYYGNSRPNAQYDWKVPFRLATILSGYGGQGPVIVRFDSSGTIPVRMQVNNNGCVSNEILFNVTVRPRPVAHMIVQSSACVDETVPVALNFISPAISNYEWGWDGGAIVYGSYPGGPYGIRWHKAGYHVISLTTTTAGCNSQTSTDTVIVHPQPAADITRTSADNICSGDSVQLEAFQGDSTDRFAWSPAGFFPVNGQPVTWAVVKRSGYISVQVTSQWGCKAADSVLVTTKPCCEVYLPSAFSPNGDGRNDYFRILTIGHHEVSDFRVVNRWGQTVFETQNENARWDGTFGGIPQNMGTYYYYVKFRCHEGTDRDIEQKGEVVLIR